MNGNASQSDSAPAVSLLEQSMQHLVRPDLGHKMVILLHIPKTAGTTLRSIFRRQYRPSEFAYYYAEHGKTHFKDRIDQLSPDEKRRFRALSGHVHYGIHHSFPQECVYITMLRDPISLNISHYYYVINSPHNVNYAAISQMSLEEFVSLPHRRNRQTRLIAGQVSDGQISDDELLECAKQHLDRHFVAVGTTERFDESLLIFQRLLGWRFPYYARRNRNRKRPARSEISPETGALILESNQLDLALVEYVEQKLQVAIDAYGSAFEADLARFRRINGLFDTPVQMALAVKSRIKGR